MTTKINLSNMKDSDYKALLENSKVMDKLIEYTNESEMLLVNEWLGLLKGLGDYSLGGSDNRNYMHVSNSHKFLNSFLIVQRDYFVLADPLVGKVEKVLSDYNDSEPVSIYDEKLDEISELVAAALVERVKTEYDYSTNESFLLNTMKEYETLIDIYGDDAYYNREDNKIYYTCSD